MVYILCLAILLKYRTDKEKIFKKYSIHSLNFVGIKYFFHEHIKQVLILPGVKKIKCTVIILKTKHMYLLGNVVSTVVRGVHTNQFLPHHD